MAGRAVVVVRLPVEVVDVVPSLVAPVRVLPLLCLRWRWCTVLVAPRWAVDEEVAAVVDVAVDPERATWGSRLCEFAALVCTEVTPGRVVRAPTVLWWATTML